ncbi:outer membrane protein [Polymorphobacter fuscus]|uniref:Outer membrane beta-barrel protein n=1 Tax=Sandarakinorhabdus fusca TaxID=1439888 RepID=A0A7C9KY34_9SPHN|nr:outer membrane beta-barrel protein [Polymorphobacter fuscus]KAB7645594.1 porin family protein [Polymorphobacter fuscus]MQT18042.1 outer membrane beta-barrel protein [Polymorphobacter fuscus]NJC08675.1 outer membrane immunogenic protein [Polymorphobacter fuscus]
MFKYAFAFAAMAAAAPVLAQDAPIPFNGPFVGVQGGWQQDRQNLRTTNGAVETRSTVKGDGFAYGGQIGYDFRLSPSVVLGAEVALTGRSGENDFNTFQLSQGRTIGATARLGTLVGPAGLVYVRGGYANARYTLDDGLSRVSENRDGYTVGAGYEQMVARNVSARVEYGFSKFGKEELGASFGNQAELDYTRHAVTAGLNLRF